MDLSDRFQINTPKIKYQIMGNKVLIINFDNGNYFSLDKVGREIWTFIIHEATVAQIIQKTTYRYGGSYKDIENAISQLINRLLQEELIIPNKQKDPLTTKLFQHNPINEKAKFENPKLHKYDHEQLLLNPFQVDEKGKKTNISKSSIPRKNFFPTQEQELLLQAVLLKEIRDVKFWEEWESSVDADRIDPVSLMLLPLMYNNPHIHGIKDQIMDKINHYYELTWYKNSMIFHVLSRLLNDFFKAGIVTMILKETALAHFYYRDYGFRPMHDFDILVRTNQISRAIDLLGTLGWVSSPPSKLLASQIPYLTRISAGYINPANQQHLDLHWHVLHECCQPEANNDFWSEAIKKEIDGIQIYLLNPADQLLHVCVHGTSWHPVPRILWIPDAMIIIESSQSDLDWDRLINQAKKHRLTLPLIDTLNYLRDTFDAPIPSSVLEGLRSITPSKMDFIEYRYRAQNHRKKLLGYIGILWFNYLRLKGNDSSENRLLGFIKHLQLWLGVTHLWQVPLYLLLTSRWRIWQLTDWYEKRAKFILPPDFSSSKKVAKIKKVVQKS